MIRAATHPSVAKINHFFLLAHIERLGNGGWIGCDYHAKGDTLEGLSWMAPRRSIGSAERSQPK